MIKTNLKYEKFNFPVGETQVKVTNLWDEDFAWIEFNYENDAEIIELLMLADAIKRQGIPIKTLKIPYVPYSRQDRVNSYGESLSIKVFCDLINSINAELVMIEDPHSDVTSALIKNCKVITQVDMFGYSFPETKDFFLVSPDAGAEKKIHRLAAFVDPFQVIQFTKHRNCNTGEITGVTMDYGDLWGRDCYIVDDICDGGRTFIEVARILKRCNAGKIYLYVTHGFFTKGLEVFDGLIDEIWTRKGKVK